MHKITVHSSNHKKILFFPSFSALLKMWINDSFPTLLTEKSKKVVFFFLPLSWVPSSHSRDNEMTSPLICSSAQAGLQVLHSLTHTTGKVLLLLPYTQKSAIIVPTAPENCAGVLLYKEQYFFIDPIEFSQCFRTCLRNGDALAAQGLYLVQTPVGLMQNSCSIRNDTTKSTY